MKRLAITLMIVAILLSLALPASAQRFTASIRGQVTSADTGATLPGASVTAVNTETGFNRTAVTNQAGSFVFGELSPGPYTVTIEFPSFKSYVVQEIVLNVADVREVSAALEVGAIEEEITVTSPAIVVETIGGEVATTITSKEIRELPLNGRNFTQLTQLMPGVSAAEGLDFKNKGLLSGVDMSVSGSMATGNQWAVDGAGNNDTGSNRTILVTPSVDAIEEFKVHRNSYGPEFGGAGGAQINLITKSGSNRYQGSVFAFMRTDSLAEKNAVLEQAKLEQEELDRKDYGFTFGGPIIQDKLLFFLSYEINDETRGTVRSAAVPTAAERMGDFSQSANPPIDPLTGQPFPGNVIPADRLSPGGLALLRLYPDPNAPGSLNWAGTVGTDIDWNQINGRLDWNVTDNSRALVRYTQDSWENPGPNAGETNGLWGDDPFPTVDSSWDQPGDSLVAQLNQTFGSSIINTLTYTRSGNEITVTRAGDSALNSEINSLIPTVFPDGGKTNPADTRAHPVYWGGATGRDLWNMAPWENQLDLDVLKNDYQQVFGNHWIKAGLLYGKSSKLEQCCGASAHEAPHFWGGTGIGGWGGASGNRIADILIKDMFHGFDEFSRQPSPEVEWEDIEVYVGDSWTVTPTLTVDFGVRYTRYNQPEEKNNELIAFYPEFFDPALGNDPCNGLAQVPGTDPCGEAGLLGGRDGVSASLVEKDTNNFAPRLGMAWDIFGDGESVLRAGAGQYFQRERVNIQLDFVQNPPFTSNTGGIRALDYAPGGTPGFGAPVRGINASNEVPSTWQYNISWEQRLWGDASIEIAYVGSRGSDLVQKYDVNQVRAGDSNGNGIDDRLEFARSGGDGDGSVRPYFTGGANRILFWDNRGKSEYDGLQTQFRKSFGRGSLVQASYTWSKFKANTGVASSSGGEEEVQLTDLDNPGLDWGYADLHRDHVFNASLVWNLPSLEGRGGFMEYVLGNWTIASVLAYSSGLPITVYANDVPGVAGGGYAGTGYDDNLRALRVSGQPCSGKGRQLLNPDAYTVAGIRLGDTSQMSKRGDCEGPDYFQLDLSFYKNISFGSAVDAQLRFEFFNLTNQTNWIGTSVDNNLRPENVVYDADVTQIVSADNGGAFGLAQAARDPRQIQLGLKLSF